MPTRFLPMSWKSPATVPRIILPTLPPPSPFRWGLSTSTPLFMARAAASICGTNMICFWNLSPTTSMASIMPVFRMSFGSTPASSAARTASGTFLFLPFSTASATARSFSTLPSIAGASALDSGAGEAAACEACGAGEEPWPLQLSMYSRQNSSRPSSALVAWMMPVICWLVGSTMALSMPASMARVMKA